MEFHLTSAQTIAPAKTDTMSSLLVWMLFFGNSVLLQILASLSNFTCHSSSANDRAASWKLTLRMKLEPFSFILCPYFSEISQSCTVWRLMSVNTFHIFSWFLLVCLLFWAGGWVPGQVIIPWSVKSKRMSCCGQSLEQKTSWRKGWFLHAWNTVCIQKMLSKCFVGLFLFCPCCMVCEILVPWIGIEPPPPVQKHGVLTTGWPKEIPQ